MKNTTLLLLLIVLSLPLTSSPRSHGGRFDEPSESSAHKSPRAQSDDSHDVTSEDDISLSATDDGDEYEADVTASHEDDEYIDVAIPYTTSSSPHSPIGSVCSNLARRYSFVANRLMTNGKHQTNRQMLRLFCSVLSLMADLADGNSDGDESNVVRADNYASDVVQVVATIKETIALDPTLTELSFHYPLLGSLTGNTVRSIRADADDNRSELGMAVYHMLRTPRSGRALVQELFAELSDIAQNKADHLMSLFRTDMQQLLDLTSRPIEDMVLRSPSRESDERKEMRQAAMLCRAAASACHSVALVAPQNDYLKHSTPLMAQLNSLLSAMAVTYDRLGAPHRLVARTDRNILAHHLAEMIHLLPTTRAQRSSRQKMSTVHLDKCTSLGSLEEQELFVQNQFERPSERDALLGEFFTVFQDTVDTNITRFLGALSHYTALTFTRRYWQGLSETTGD